MNRRVIPTTGRQDAQTGRGLPSVRTPRGERRPVGVLEQHAAACTGTIDVKAKRMTGSHFAAGQHSSVGAVLPVDPGKSYDLVSDVVATANHCDELPNVHWEQLVRPPAW